MQNEKVIKRASKELEKTMFSIEQKEDMISVIKKESEALRKTIKESMLKDKVDSYIADDGQEKQLQASVYQSTKVDYNLEAIKEKLPKEKRRLVVKSIMIVDETNLKEFLRNHPELRDEVKTFVSKVEVIDENKLSLALDYNNITLEDIKGCYTVKNTDNFKLQRVKAKELL